MYRIEDGKSCTNVSDWKEELLSTFSPANSNVAWNELFIWHFKRYQMHIKMHTDVQWKENFNSKIKFEHLKFWGGQNETKI